MTKKLIAFIFAFAFALPAVAVDTAEAPVADEGDVAVEVVESEALNAEIAEEIAEETIVQESEVGEE
ncbi:MAG: hypothetical protein FWG80_03590 [Alphaproteobacteria bacterium]|nr:hypothetical protein [Alphaproteobacteria bacterium]